LLFSMSILVRFPPSFLSPLFLQLFEQAMELGDTVHEHGAASLSFLHLKG
jgi:hypothetical protein